MQDLRVHDPRDSTEKIPKRELKVINRYVKWFTDIPRDSTEKIPKRELKERSSSILRLVLIFEIQQRKSQKGN